MEGSHSNANDLCLLCCSNYLPELERVELQCCRKCICLRCVAVWLLHYGSTCPFCNFAKETDVKYVVHNVARESESDNKVHSTSVRPALEHFLNGCPVPVITSPWQNEEGGNMASPRQYDEGAHLVSHDAAPLSPRRPPTFPAHVRSEKSCICEALRISAAVTCAALILGSGSLIYFTAF